MTRQALLDLAARCEAATGADRELDAEIAASLRIGTEHQWAHNYPEWAGRSDGRVYLEQGGPSFTAPAYTASLDEAMTLVPEGFWWSIVQNGEKGFDAACQNRGEALRWHTAPTPALALTAACLKALA